MYNKILITGGNGFVGKNFDIGIKLSRRDCNLLKFDETVETFKRISPDAIIHTAGLIGGVWGNRLEKGRYCYENVQINTNVIEAARITGVTRVLSFLSTCMYPISAPMPYMETDIHNGLPHEDHFGYAYSKRMLDIISRAYSEQYGVCYNSIIPSNIYGPYDNFGKETGHVTPTLIARCYEAKRDNKPFVVWGSGTPKRELIYVEDIVNISKWALDNYLDTTEPLNVVGPTTVTIKELAELIAEIMEFEGEIIWDRSRPDGQAEKGTSMKKFFSLCPEYRFATAKEGLTETIKWFKKLHE